MTAALLWWNATEGNAVLRQKSLAESVDLNGDSYKGEEAVSCPQDPSHRHSGKK